MALGRMFYGVRLGEAGFLQIARGFLGLETGFLLDAAGLLLGGAALGLLLGLAAGDRGFRRAGEADIGPVGAKELRRGGLARRFDDHIGLEQWRRLRLRRPDLLGGGENLPAISAPSRFRGGRAHPRKRPREARGR